MKFILPIVILFSASVFGQRSEKELRDSINYYERIIGAIGHRYMDSLRKTPEYQAGVGFEIVTSPSKYSGGGIVFVKGGINRPIGNEKYKIKGIVYDPGISYGNWIITIGVKFFGRR